MSKESLNDRRERMKAIAELRVLQEDHPSALYLLPLIALLQDWSPDRSTESPVVDLHTVRIEIEAAMLRANLTPMQAGNFHAALANIRQNTGRYIG